MGEIYIHRMAASDAPACTRIHLRAFEGFFLTFLGADFLRELYSAIASDPSGIGFVAADQARLLGFVVGSDRPAGLYTRLLRQRLWRFGRASLGAFLKKPSILPRLLRAFTMPAQQPALPDCAVLMSIAVDPSAQGQGVGGLLVKAFLEEARQRGLQYVILTTDRLDNDSANRFYQRLGFSLLRDFTTPEGRPMNEYSIPLSPCVDPPASIPSPLPFET